MVGRPSQQLVSLYSIWLESLKPTGPSGGDLEIWRDSAWNRAKHGHVYP